MLALARIALAAIMWLVVPANLIGGGALLAVGLSAGYLKGHAVATRTGSARVAHAVTQTANRIEDAIEDEAEANAQAANEAAHAVPPVVPGPAHRPDRDAIKRLCAADPACRRNGS